MSSSISAQVAMVPTSQILPKLFKELTQKALNPSYSGSLIK